MKLGFGLFNPWYNLAWYAGSISPPVGQAQIEANSVLSRMFGILELSLYSLTVTSIRFISVQWRGINGEFCKTFVYVQMQCFNVQAVNPALQRKVTWREG